MLSHPRHGAAELPGDVPFSLMVGDTLLIQSARVIRIQVLNLKLLRPKVGTDAAVKLITTGLGNDLHYAARRLAVLRLVATCFHIDFFDKREIDAGRESAVISREDANTAKNSIGYADTVGYVLIFQPAASRNGGVGRTCPATLVHSRSRIEQAGHVASNWHLRIEGVVQVR